MFQSGIFPMPLRSSQWGYFFTLADTYGRRDLHRAEGLSAISVVCHITVWCAKFHKSMRRVVASLVLCVVAWSFLAPLALAAAGDPTPACCRRTGKHHCKSGSQRIVVVDDGIPVFWANSPDCPYRTQIATPTVSARPQYATTSALLLHSSDFVLTTLSPFVSRDASASDRPRGPPIV